MGRVDRQGGGGVRVVRRRLIRGVVARKGIGGVMQGRGGRIECKRGVEGRAADR